MFASTIKRTERVISSARSVGLIFAVHTQDALCIDKSSISTCINCNAEFDLKKMFEKFLKYKVDSAKK